MYLSQKFIRCAIHTGIKNAFKRHKKWTGGQWLSWAPEYVLTTYIAESLYEESGNHYIFLEHDIRDAMKGGGYRKQEMLSHKNLPDGNADICIFDNNYDLYSVIEIKRIYNGFSSIKDDIFRIEEMLDEEPTIEFGAAGVVLHKWGENGIAAKSRLKRSFNNIKKKIEERNWKMDPSEPKIDECDEEAWTFFVGYITPARIRKL